jgi:transposase InsO family protein
VEEISGEETAALYAKHVFARYGLPTKIISDRDPRFASKFTRELCKLLGIQQNISTAYHPRTDGQSERSNQWLEQYLHFWVNERQDDWAQYLPLAGICTQQLAERINVRVSISHFDGIPPTC